MRQGPGERLRKGRPGMDRRRALTMQTTVTDKEDAKLPELRRERETLGNARPQPPTALDLGRRPARASGSEAPRFIPAPPPSGSTAPSNRFAPIVPRLFT